MAPECPGKDGLTKEDSMEILKFLHILGVVLMVGNVITTGLWAHWASKSDEESLRKFASISILKADLFLTFTGGGLILVSGFAMAGINGLTFQENPWLVQGIVALAVSTIVWLLVLLPDQFRMKTCAESGDSAGFIKAYRRWSLLGWLATIPLVYGIWVMVVR